MLQTPETRISPWPHRLAWLLACTTFPLVWWGGFVTATGSGMAFKDWLTSDGVFMPFYPWLSSAGDKFIEHGHRLLGMLAGVLTIALVVSLWIAEPRRWVRLFGAVLFAGVVVQGVLGGLRVVLDERVLALLHGCAGPLFFAACATMVVITSPRWAETTADTRGMADAKLLQLSVFTATLAYLQLAIGAVVRHSPLMLSESAARIFQIAVYFHVLMAIIVTAHVVLLAHRCFWRGVCPGLALSLAALIAVQLLLGVGTWLVKYGVPQWATAIIDEWSFSNTESGLTQAGIIAGHGAAGSLIVALCVVMALEVARRAGLSPLTRRPVGAPLAGAAS